MDIDTPTLIGFGLLIISEILGMSRFKDHSILQLILHLAQERFPYELKRKQATADNRPQLRRLGKAKGILRRIGLQ